MNETLKTIHSLTTTHGDFTDRPVRPEDLEAIVQASLRAANASSRQCYSLIAVEDRQTIFKLCGYNGAAAIVYCVDYNRLVDTAAFLGEKYSVDGFMDFITGSTDTILAAQTGAIAARSLGVDSLFTNGIHRGDISRVYNILNLPDQYCVPLIMLVLGYREQPRQPRGRLDGAGVVHHGEYRRITKARATEITGLYDEKENRLGIDSDWSSSGYEHYLDWFFNEWTHSDPQRGLLFETLLREKGFLS